MGELVSLTDSDDWYLMLTGQIGGHRGAHLRDDTTVAQDVASSYEQLCRAGNQSANALDQRVDAPDSASAQSFDQSSSCEGWTSVNYDHCDVVALFVGLHEKPLHHVIDSNDHDSVASLL